MGNVFSTPFAGIKHFKGKIMVIYIHINFKRRALIVYKQWLSLKFIIINLYVGNHLHLVINI
jgi:hypothetical protein